MGGRTRYVCWDLDETLGRLRPPEGTGLQRKRGLTRGIGKVLEERLSSGCGNVLTTAAEASYAESSLSEYGLRGFFDHIFDRSVICDARFNKSYLNVARALGIHEDDAGDRIIVVGNLAKDGPADTDIPFLYHPSAVEYHAEVIAITLRYMHLFGSWRRAQEALANVQNPMLETVLTETYESERLILQLSGTLSRLDGGITLMGGRCGISFIENGTDLQVFERTVGRMIMVYQVDPALAAEVEDSYPAMALAVNQ